MKKTALLLLITFLLIFHLSLFANDSEHGIKENIQNKINQINVNDETKVFLISMIPIFELRGAIPIGLLSYKLPLWKVFPIAIAGNMVPIFFILLFFGFITNLLSKIPVLKKILDALFARTRRKGAVIEKYEELGLMLFVAIPLPITGAWTGSLAAYLFGLSFLKSITFIFLGVFIAAIIVSILSLLGWLGAIIALLAIILLVIVPALKKKKYQ
jgi:uncharacterized membrane protein